MTQAVVTRRDGDVFQARMFWLLAARLLDEHSPVMRVGFESGLKGYDDIWVEYDPKRAPQDHRGRSVHIQRMQCKWHATPGVFTHGDLIRPEYINAVTHSMLERALAAYRVDSAAGHASQLVLVTNHMVDQNDVLASHIRMKSLSLDVDGLFKGKTTRSATGKLRQLWLDHLGINDVELRGLCQSLGFNLTRDSLDALREQLDGACRANGLVRPEPNASSTIYDGNIYEWVGQHRLEFDRKSFKEKCTQEGLLSVPGKAAPLVFGVKSFEHPLDRLDHRCADVLNLVSEFDERTIRDDSAWRCSLVPKLQDFLLNVPHVEGRLRLALETHATLAFAAGTILNTKSGRLVELEQRSPVLQIWAPDDCAVDSSHPVWSFESIDLDSSGSGTACAVNITRNTTGAVRHFIQQNNLGLRRLIVATPAGGTSVQAVMSGAHANQLAEQLASKLAAERLLVPTVGRERYHLFIAAPNAFTFYLGRQAPLMKPLTLYEFDFEYHRDGSYRPSLSYPEISVSGEGVKNSESRGR